MIDSYETKNIIFVYNELIKHESRAWGDLDNYLELLDYLNDLEICREAAALYFLHKTKNMGCNKKHAEGHWCFARSILDAVESILNLYEENEGLHPKNRYILGYYLALTHDGQIRELLESEG